MSVLDDRVGIVTGAGRGIGRGIARALAREGMNLVLVERDAATLNEAADEISELGVKVRPFLGDVTDPGCSVGAAQAAVDVFGRLDALVNNAQVLHPNIPFEEHSDDDLEICLSTGLWGTFRFMRACFPALSTRGGAIVNMASSAGTHGLAGYAGYAAAKEAIRGLTKVAANEWGPHEIRVNAICPQATSPAAAAYFAEHPERQAAKVASRPIKRDGDAELDIGRAAVFLVSPDSRFITGMTVMVNGGLTIMP